jgi:hypothetical protein
MVWTPEFIMLAVIGALVFAIFVTSIVSAVKSESCKDESKSNGASSMWSVVNPYSTGSGGMPVRAAAPAPISRR